MGLAFLDVMLYVTSIKVFKNLILISDIEKSVWFISLQVRNTCTSYPEAMLSKNSGGSVQAHHRQQRPSTCLFAGCRFLGT